MGPFFLAAPRAAWRGWCLRRTKSLVRALGAPPEYVIPLGETPRPFTLAVVIESWVLWAEEPPRRKVAALLRRRWSPQDARVQELAEGLFRTQVFGGVEDAGDDLWTLNCWHLERDWQLDAMSDEDQKRADALSAFAVLTRNRYSEIRASWLNLLIAARYPYVTDLLYPMVAKMPVLSVRYYLDLDAHFAFDAIRRAQHPHADAVVAYLYDLLFLQQKTGLEPVMNSRGNGRAD